MTVSVEGYARKEKSSALQRVKELSAKNDLRSSEVSEDAPHAGTEANSDSDVPPSLYCQEHIPSASCTSDEHGLIDNRVLVDGGNEVVVTNDADGENICQQGTGGETTDRKDASVADDNTDKESRPDHSEGALEAKRRKLCILEVK